MKSFREKAVFITGASSGIGRALALEFASQGANLVLLARRKALLEETVVECGKRGSRAIAVECDVAKDGDLEAGARQAREAFGKIDVVVANAGFGVVGDVSDLDIDDFRRQFETNVFGVLRTIYATLDDLKRSCGNLVLIGSVAGHVSMTGASPYSMSKFAIRALAESLRYELRPSGVEVTLISPGFVESQIYQVNNKGVLQSSAKLPIPSWIRMPADRAAREIVRAVSRGKSEKVVTGHGKVIVFLNRHFPALTAAAKRLGARGRSSLET